MSDGHLPPGDPAEPESDPPDEGSGPWHRFRSQPVWLQILAWKEEGWGYRRIARELNGRDIPSPYAGVVRVSSGVPAPVSGRWSPTTVADLCRKVRPISGDLVDGFGVPVEMLRSPDLIG